MPNLIESDFPIFLPIMRFILEVGFHVGNHVDELG